jgi:hypothetical protein
MSSITRQSQLANHLTKKSRNNLQSLYDEHSNTLTPYLNDTIQSSLDDAKAGKRAVFFIDAAHFALANF